MPVPGMRVQALTGEHVRQSAMVLRRVRIARADGGTWAQVAPLLGVTGAAAAKREAHRLERELGPVASRMLAAKRIAAELVPDP